MMVKQSVARSRLTTSLFGVLILFSLYLTSLHSYLLFHSLAELFSIVVAFGIFIIFWNARRFVRNSYFLFLGISYLFIAVVDLIHTLAYPGMNVVPGSDTNLAAQLWIAARYLQSVSLVIAPLFLGRRLRGAWVAVGYGLGVGLLLGAILSWGVFPACFVEGVGLTSFKVISEYIISLILLASLAVLYRNRRAFEAGVLQLLMASIIVAVASELAFTQYAHAYALANLTGHLLKIVSFYLIYNAVVETGLVRPYDLLFRDLKREQEALAESEERYRTLFEALPVGVRLATLDGQVLAANFAMCQMMGYSEAELQDISLPRTYLDPQDRRELVERMERDGSVRQFEVTLTRKDGTAFHASLTATPSIVGGREVILTVVQDVTERKQMEESLQESEEKYRTLVENTEDVIYAIDASGDLVYASPSVEAVLGYGPSEVIGRPFAEFLSPQDCPAANEAFRIVLAGDHVGVAEYRVVSKSGEIRWMRTSSAPAFTGDVVTGVQGVLSDITERKQAEEEAAHERDLMRTLLVNVPDYIHFKDRDRRFVRASTSFTDFFKCSLEEIIGKKDEQLFPQEIAEETANDDRHVIETGTALINKEERVESINGEEQWVLTTKLPWYDRDGNIVGLFGVSREITDRRLAEQEALEAKEAAEAASREAEERRLEAEHRREVAESLADVMSVLNSSQTLDEVLDYITSQAGRLLDNQAGAIYKLEDDGKLSVRAAQGLLLTYVVGQEIPVGQQALEQAMASGKAVTIPHLGTHLAEEGRPSRDAESEALARTWADLYQALLAVPITVGDQPYGGIALYYAEPREFPEEEVRLATIFGDQVALAIENARLRDQVREAATIAERERLAGDLHDAVTQTLFSAGLIAETLPRIWERNPERAKEGLAELRQLTQGALAEMRTLLLELRPAALTERSLGELLSQLRTAVTSRSRVPVDLTVEGDSSLPPRTQIALYRIAQEALNNIAKHASPTEVSIRLRCEPGRVALSIQDDGRGFDPTDALADQLGLGIMRERAESIGATLEITSEPGHGTHVTVGWEETDRRQSDE